MSETYPGQMLPELQEKTTVDSNDLFYMVSSNASKKIKGSNLKAQMKPSDYTGATSSTNGANGLVPQPTTSDVDRFLKGDGTWGDISYAVGEVSGSIATFSDGSPLPMRSLKAYIEPVQSGSGDPSPTNIRPISGWTACNVVRTRKNYFKYNKVDNQNALSEKIPWQNGLKFKNFGSAISNGSLSIKYLDKLGTVIESSVKVYYISEGYEFTFSNPPSGTAYIQLASYRSTANGGIDEYISASFMVGTDISTYEPYNGSTYTIQFTDGSNPLTVYGGYVDIVSGLLVVNKLSALISDLTLTRPANRVGYRLASRDFLNTIKQAVDNDDVVDISCDLYKKDSVTNIYNGSMAIGVNPSGEIWMMCPNDITSADDFKTIYGAYRIVYPLATPQTYQLTAQQVKSLLGENRVWADTGDVDVHYVRDLTITIDDILSRLEALEG